MADAASPAAGAAGGGAPEALPQAKFDIFMTRVAKFLDPQFVVLVLSNFLVDLKIYDQKEMLRMQMDLARRTRLFDLWEDTYQSLHGADAALPPEIAAARQASDEEFERLYAACGPLIDIVGLEPGEGEKEAELRKEENFHAEFLAAEYGVTPAHIEALLPLAKLRYDEGNDQSASDLLAIYQELRFPPGSAAERSLPLELLWGRFAAALMKAEGDWESATQMREKISEALADPARPLTDMQRLQSRVWLLHWCLFNLAYVPGKRDALLDWYMSDDNLNAIALTCPWMLRYLISAGLQHRKRGAVLRQLTRLITPDVLAQGDPLVAFLAALLQDFDFDTAQALVPDCASAIATDFFLSRMLPVGDFMAAARSFVFDVYARVHQKIDLRLLASQLGMGVEEAEVWVVDLIRSAHLDAKVDSKAKTVEMIQPAASLHGLVVDRVRDAAGRARHLLEQVEAITGEGSGGGRGGR